MRKKCTVLYSFLVLTLMFAAAPRGVAQEASGENPPLPELSHLLQQSETYPEIGPDLNLRDNYKKILGRIRAQEEDEFLVVDEDWAQRHFERQAETELRNILDRWGLQALKTDRYLSIPFFVTAERDEPAEAPVIRFVVSEKLPDAVASRQLYYRVLLRTYAALPNDLKSSPSAWTHGLASLAALDMTHPTSLARCPDIPVETTLAALLFHNNPDLLSRAFPDEEGRFSSESYQSELRLTLRALGSADPDGALEELLRSPEEYYAIGQSEFMEAEAAEKEEKSFAPLVHPAVRILWMALPDDPDALRGAVDSGLNNLQNSSLQAVYLNTAYDKLCALIGEQQEGMVTDSGMLLAQAARNDLDDMGVQNHDRLLNEFETRREQAWRGFKKELDAREYSKQKKASLVYDPLLLKWTFRFLYNYSLEVRKAQEVARQKIKKEEGAMSDQAAEEKLANRADREMVEKWWRADPLLQRLFDRVGFPDVTVIRNSETSTTKRGIRLNVVWTLQRYKTGEKEEVKISIVDPMSSGGGKPKEGVADSAKVVARRAPGEDAELIELGDVRKNYWVRTVNKIGAPDESADQPEPKEKRDEEEPIAADWARVVKVEHDSTSLPGSIDSGGRQSLKFGRKQLLWSKLEEEKKWNWQNSIQLRKSKDALFGIRPGDLKGQIGRAELFAAEIKAVDRVSTNTGLTQLTLSYRDTQGIKESGALSWGYFANARLVHARVKKAPVGVDGEAMIEIPDGTTRLATLKAGKDKDGDAVHVFNFGSSKTFLDWVQKKDSLVVKYYITVAYELPDGTESTLRVAEGQDLVVLDRAEKTLGYKRAYQLKPSHELVCGFGPGGRPATAAIKAIEAHDATISETRVDPLAVYSAKLKNLPLVRVNGVLARMEVPPLRAYPGVAAESLVQMSPSLDVVRNAESGRINLQDARVQRASEVGGGSLVLSYNVDLEPEREFCQLQISGRADYSADQYIRIQTDRGTLDCGHKQGVYRTKKGWDHLRLVAASAVKPGDKIVWLDKGQSDNGAKGASSDQLRTVVGRAADRVLNEATTSPGETADGTVRLIRVQSVEPMFPTEATPKRHLCEYGVPETDETKLGYNPNLFANGILVSVKVMSPPPSDGLGPGRGRFRTHPKPIRTTIRGRHKPGFRGVIREQLPPDFKLSFSNEDLAQIKRNRDLLVTALDDAKIRQGAVRWEAALSPFLAHYFSSMDDPGPLYASLNGYLGSYLQARDFLVGTTNPRVLPAMVNAYVFLATLVYEAGGTAAGDALTRDFLDIMLRVIHSDGEPVGKRVYKSEKFLVRPGIKAVRDILLYVRNRNQTDGLGPVRETTFEADSFSRILEKLVKRGCHPDIANKAQTKVRLYHLCRQLDRWAKTELELVDTFIAPGYDPSKLFQGSQFRNRLKITTREASDNE